MTTDTVYTSQDVTDAITTFNHLADDVLRAREDAWVDNLSLFLNHCHQNPIIQAIIEPLMLYPAERYQEWFLARRNASRRRKEDVPFPDNEDERLAVFYKIIMNYWGEHNKRTSLATFIRHVYGTPAGVEAHEVNVKFFKEQIFFRFQRAIRQKLENIHHSLSGQQEIQREALTVFHIENHGTMVTGGINADHSQVAVGHSQITDSMINDTQHLKNLLLQLSDLIDTVEESQRPVVQEAIRELSNAVENPTVSKVQLAKNVETIASHSPQMASFLKDIAAKTGASLAASGIIHAIQFVLHHAI